MEHIVIIIWCFICCVIAVFDILYVKEKMDEEILILIPGAIAFLFFIQAVRSGWLIFNGLLFVKSNYIYILIVLLVIRTIIMIVIISTKITERKRKRERKINKKINKKAEKKVINFLLHRTRKKINYLLSHIDTDTAEIVEAMRKKSNEIYNDFSHNKIDFKKAETTLEEIISDLIVIKGVVNADGAEITYHDLLGINVNAQETEIKSAYRNIMKIIHPDIAGKECNNLTSLVNKAYDRLISA